MENDASRNVLITGASSGIGAAFARQAASQGHDLILVARREDRLKALADELKGQHGVEIEILVADLSRLDDIERVGRRIAACKNLEILINNAGFGTTPMPFSHTDLKRQLDMIWVHDIATVCLTRAALPQMIARGRGAVINVSSSGAFLPIPGNVTYCASKSFLTMFTEVLAAELKHTGVKVQALCPGFTRSEFHETPEFKGIDVKAMVPKALWMEPDEVAAASLLALERGLVYCIPGCMNRMMVTLGRIGLSSLLSKVMLERFRT